MKVVWTSDVMTASLHPPRCAKRPLYIAHASFAELYTVRASRHRCRRSPDFQRSPYFHQHGSSVCLASCYTILPLFSSSHPPLKRMVRSGLKYWSASPVCHFSVCLAAAEDVSEHTPTLSSITR